MSFHPQTPQSPSQFSPATSDAVPSLSSSMTSLTSTLPTPAHSVNGSSVSQLPEMAHDTSSSMSDDLSQKRKRGLEDVGDRDVKKVHIDDPKLNIEDLHLDVGEKFLLCRKPVTIPRYMSSTDLFETFNLTSLAVEMAREKPNGEKNTLRKSFKGQLKRLDIDGAYDTKRDEKDETDPDGFFAMLALPEDVWYANHVKEKDVRDGFSAATLAALPKAMTMLKGKIRKDHWDPYILGALEKASTPLGDGLPGNKTTEPNTPGGSTPLAMARSRSQNTQASAAGTPGQDPARPRRNIKKRSYGDSSFEGYGEGFPDDDAGLDTGYSTGEGDDRGLKRRKKAAGGTQPFPSAIRKQNYGPGMVGA